MLTAMIKKNLDLRNDDNNAAKVARSLEQDLNLMGHPSGEVVGLYLRQIHRTLQREIVAFCLGVLCGLAQQDHTDARNETAIATCKKIDSMCDNGELDAGPFI